MYANTLLELNIFLRCAHPCISIINVRFYGNYVVFSMILSVVFNLICQAAQKALYIYTSFSLIKTYEKIKLQYFQTCAYYKSL